MIERDNYQGGIIILEKYQGDYRKYMQVYLMLSGTCLFLKQGSHSLLSPDSGEHSQKTTESRTLNIHQFSCIGLNNLRRNIAKKLAEVAQNAAILNFFEIYGVYQLV